MPAYSMFRFANRFLSPAGAGARLSILIYHRVVARPDPLLPDVLDARTFEQLMQALRSSFNVLPLGEAVQRLQQGTLPARPACITFDDGYADNASVALPILQKLGLHATFFVSPGYLNGGRMWNDTVYETVRHLPAGEIHLARFNQPSLHIDSAASRRLLAETVIKAVKHLPPQQRQHEVNAFSATAKNLPADLMMTDAQVCALHQAGMTVGAHTMSHPILAKTDNTVAEQEISESKNHLENLLQNDVNLFAYPNGKPVQDYLPQHVRMVRACGFKAAVSTAWGVSTKNTDPFQLPRFTPWDHTSLRFLAQLTLNLRRKNE